jgi:hypothetical protein
MGFAHPKEKVARMLGTPFLRIVILALATGTMLLSPRTGRSLQQDQPMSNMHGNSGASKSSSGGPCDDLSSMGGMSVMGESMGAMTNHI